MTTYCDPANDWWSKNYNANCGRGIWKRGTDRLRGLHQSELDSLSQPEPDTGRDSDQAEQPELPECGTVAEHFAAVPNTAEGTGADIETVGHQTDSGEES